jgi:hypothetical protein
MSPRFLSIVPVVLLAVTGCVKRQDTLTSAEAQEALDEMQTDTTAQALTSGTVEITTKFTIGDAVEKAADDVRAFIESELPCASVTLSANTLSIEYGVNGVCLFNGQTFTGTHTVSISKNDKASEVIVDHTWDALSNGKVRVDGTATATWSLGDLSNLTRHIQHDLKWTRLSDGRTGEGAGDRTQRALGGDIKVGFTEDGQRTWDGKRGHWNLDISNIEVRWADPVPQAGSLTLDTPFDKTVAASFDRVDASTIKVTIQGPNRSFDFDVKSGS